MNELSKAQRLRGKNVVIIGGSRGLGKTIVAATHAEGARVLAVARRGRALRQLAAEIPGGRPLCSSPGARLLVGRRFQVATPARSARRCFSRIMPRRNPLACNSVCSFSRSLRGASCPKRSWGKRLLKRMLPLSVFHLPILSKIWEQR